MLKYEIISVTPFAQNSSLLWDSESLKAVLIDPGGDVHKIKARIVQQGLVLEQIWLTHAHIDHAGAAKELSDDYSAPIIGPHEGDLFWLENLPKQSKMFGFPDVAAFMPSRWLKGGDKLSLGAYDFEVRHCPGHTPGHVVIYSKDLEKVFVGDVLFVGSIGRTDFPGGNHNDLIHSIKTQLLSLPDDTGFIPGHGPEGYLGQERLQNPYLAGIRDSFK